MNTAGWVDCLSILTSFILSCLFDFFYLFFMSRGPLWYDSSHHSCSSCFCSHHRCCCWICCLQKEERWEIQSNSAKLSYIISVLLSILNMVIVNLCKRVGLCFFSVSERRPTSCKYDFIVCYLYFPLWSDSLDLKHYLCNRYIFFFGFNSSWQQCWTDSTESG